MNSQNCKIGKTRRDISLNLPLEALEKSYKRFLEDAYNLKFANASLSDILYHEASKLKKQILGIKSINA